MNLPRQFLVFDVESLGLHGEAFAFGSVRLDTQSWQISRPQLFACHPDHARGYPGDRNWVAENIPYRTLDEYAPKTCLWVDHPAQVREHFWAEWARMEAFGAWAAAEVAWPVEARFLNECIDDKTFVRKWQGPYPLIDIASVRLAAGFDPLAASKRFENELPAHNPLADATQSARLLAEALQLLSA